MLVSIIFGSMWCILVCHPHLTITICCVAVWAQACGLERKTSFCHYRASLVRSASSIVFCLCRCLGGSSITTLPLLVQIIRTFATVTTFVLCVWVNTYQHRDTVDFVQDSETEDPHCFWTNHLAGSSPVKSCERHLATPRGHWRLQFHVQCCVHSCRDSP